MEVTKLPLPDSMTRIESGPIQFGDDWPGIFLRGDDAMAAAHYIANAADELENIHFDPIVTALMRGISVRLQECQYRGSMEPDRTKPPCLECSAKTKEEAETACICAGDKDSCHGSEELWP